MNNEKYIQNWLEGSLNEEDRRVFEKTEDYESLQKLDKALQNFKAPTFDVKSELARLNHQKGLSTKTIQVSWVKPLLRLAATVTLMLLGYYMFIYDAITTVKTEMAQKTELVLPDQSMVILNAASTLSYVENEWEEQRQVELYGEAYFMVEKGSRFDVATASGVVTVLGTQFNIKVRDDFFEVICYEGLVAVESGDKTVKLSPNHMFRMIGDEVLLDSAITDNSPSWLVDESSFISVPFEQVVKEFERQYNVSITTKNVDLGQLFTGRFKHNDISLALKSISLPLNLDYEQEEDQHIVLSGDIE